MSRLRRTVGWLVGVALPLTVLACNAPATGVTPIPTPEGTVIQIETGEPIAITTVVPSPTPIEMIEIEVYFTNQNAYDVGTPPFEQPVMRLVPADSYLPEAILIEFFKGPTQDEMAQGLVFINSGFTGLERMVVEDGIAHVYLQGECASNGATYTIAQPVMANLLQFDEVEFVKIYDEHSETHIPDGSSNSIPFCLEP